MITIYEGEFWEGDNQFLLNKKEETLQRVC